MNAVINLDYDIASQWMQQHQQKAILPSICSNYTMPDPNLEAGHTCLLDGINVMPGEYSNTAFTIEDCFDAGGNWTSYTCKDVQTLYTNSIEANAASDSMLQLLDMTSTSLKDICCNDTSGNSTAPLMTKEEIRDFWWNALQEWREGHSKNLTVIMGVMSIVSVIASSIFVWMILRSHDGLSTTQNRLFLWLCTGDIFFSLSRSFFGVLLPNEVGYYSWNAMGNMATCQIQGFMNVFGSVCGTWYNASLCLYYLAVVKYKKSDDYIRTKIEPFLHAAPVLVAMIFNVYTVSSGRMNAGLLGMCGTVRHDPPHCWNVENDFVVEGVFDIPCGRGDSNYVLFFFLFIFICTICPAAIMITALTMIYRAVRKSEKKMSKYGVGGLRKSLQTKAQDKTDSVAVIEAHPPGSRSSPSLSHRLGLGRLSRMGFNKSPKRTTTPTKKKKRKGRSKSRLVMFQAFAYSCSWLLTWIVVIPVMMMTHVFVSSMPPAVYYYLLAFFYPLQGVYNLAIYMYPKILNARKKSKGDNNITWWRAFVMAFWSKGINKKKNGGRNVRDPPTSTLRKNCSNHDSNKGRTYSPQAHDHLSFGRIRRTDSIYSTCLPSISEV